MEKDYEKWQKKALELFKGYREEAKSAYALESQLINSGKAAALSELLSEFGIDALKEIGGRDE